MDKPNEPMTDHLKWHGLWCLVNEIALHAPKLSGGLFALLPPPTEALPNVYRRLQALEHKHGTRVTEMLGSLGDHDTLQYATPEVIALMHARLKAIRDFVGLHKTGALDQTILPFPQMPEEEFLQWLYQVWWPQAGLRDLAQRMEEANQQYQVAG